MDDELLQPTTSRGGFLRKFGTTLAIGLGVSAVPARALAGLSSQERIARPDSVAYSCCPDDGTHCTQNCGSGKNNYYCTSAECQAFPFCYGCHTNTGSCFSDVLPGCVVAVRPPKPSHVNLGRLTL